MTENSHIAHDQRLLRLGAVCAIAGAVVSIIAGAGFNNLTNTGEAKEILATISSQPDWFWPAVHLGFIIGAFLWAGAFGSLAASLRRELGWSLARWASSALIIGAAIHVVDASLNGFVMSELADLWARDGGNAQVVQSADTLLLILKGLWANVLIFFHGISFILMGMAVAKGEHYPAWLGWIGAFGGAGSLVIGTLMFVNANLLPEGLFIAFAIVVSLWMIVMGALMWRRAARL